MTTLVNCCVFGRNLSGFSSSLGRYFPTFLASVLYIGFAFCMTLTLAVHICSKGARNWQIHLYKRKRVELTYTWTHQRQNIDSLPRIIGGKLNGSISTKSVNSRSAADLPPLIISFPTWSRVFLVLFSVYVTHEKRLAIKRRKGTQRS